MNYFAYGPDLSHKLMKEVCPDSEPKFRADLPNYKLIFIGWERKWRGGAATIRPFRGGRVIGAVYEISESDLRRLDRQEGYPALSDRLNVAVVSKDGELVEAVTYIKRDQSEETKPSPQSLAAIRQGYQNWL